MPGSPNFAQLRAILWAQFRAQRNYYLRAHKAGVFLSWFSGFLWYRKHTRDQAGALGPLRSFARLRRNVGALAPPHRA